MLQEHIRVLTKKIQTHKIKPNNPEPESKVLYSSDKLKYLQLMNYSFCLERNLQLF